jgi:hypothetical protein
MNLSNSMAAIIVVMDGMTYPELRITKQYI